MTDFIDWREGINFDIPERPLDPPEHIHDWEEYEAWEAEEADRRVQWERDNDEW